MVTEDEIKWGLENINEYNNSNNSNFSDWKKKILKNSKIWKRITEIENTLRQMLNLKKSKFEDIPSSHAKNLGKTLNTDTDKYRKSYNEYWKNYLLKRWSKEEEISDNENEDFNTIGYPVNKRETKNTVKKINKMVKFKDKTEKLWWEKMVLDMIETVKSWKNVGLIFAHSSVKDIPLFACYFLRVAMRAKYSVEEIANYFQVIIWPAITFHKEGFEMINALWNTMKTRPNKKDFIEAIDTSDVNKDEKETMKKIINIVWRKFIIYFAQLIKKNNANKQWSIFFVAPTWTSAATNFKEILFNWESDEQTLDSLWLLETLWDYAKIYNIWVNNLKFSRKELIWWESKIIKWVNKAINKVRKTPVIIKLKDITDEFKEFKKVSKTDRKNRIGKAKPIFDSLANCLVDNRWKVIWKNVTKTEVLKMKTEMKENFQELKKKFKKIKRPFSY